jgi:hypothetical protein
LRWKVFLGLVAVREVLQAVFYVSLFCSPYGFFLLEVLSAVPTWGRLFLAVWLIVVAILDATRPEQRDWLHWLGVGSYVATSSAVVVWIVGRWFIDVP